MLEGAGADLKGRALAIAGVGFALLDLHTRTLSVDENAQALFSLEPHYSFDEILERADGRSRDLLRALVGGDEPPPPAPHEVRVECADGRTRVARVALTRVLSESRADPPSPPQLKVQPIAGHLRFRLCPG